MFGTCVVVWLLMSYLAEVERAGFFTLIVIWQSVFYVISNNVVFMTCVDSDEPLQPHFKIRNS